MKNYQDEKSCELLSFILIATMQVSFLSDKVTKEILGNDFKQAKEQRLFIETIVSLLLNNQKDNYENT